MNTFHLYQRILFHSSHVCSARNEYEYNQEIFVCSFHIFPFPSQMYNSIHNQETINNQKKFVQKYIIGKTYCHHFFFRSKNKLLTYKRNVKMLEEN